MEVRWTWIEEESSVCYMDGSKTIKGVDVDVHGPKINLFTAQGASPTIFQTKIHALDVSELIALRVNWIEMLDERDATGHKNRLSLMLAPKHRMELA